MQGYQRKIVYVALFEGLAIVLSSTGLAFITDKGVATAGAVAVTASVVAIVWNLIYTTLFERWESRQKSRKRTFLRRAGHAFGFETGMVALMLPVFSFALNVSLGEALVMQIGLVLFFLVYTFTFNLAFDKVFGLPASAR